MSGDPEETPHTQLGTQDRTGCPGWQRQDSDSKGTMTAAPAGGQKLLRNPWNWDGCYHYLGPHSP